MLNDFSFMGIIVKDIRILHSDRSSEEPDVAHMRIAIPQDYDIKSRDKSDSFFCTVICFGKLARYISKYGKKGDVIVGRGHLRNSRWMSKTGEECSTIDIMAERIYIYQLNKGRLEKESNIVNSNNDLEERKRSNNRNIEYLYNFGRIKLDTYAEPIVDGVLPTEVIDNTIFTPWMEKDD